MSRRILLGLSAAAMLHAAAARAADSFTGPFDAVTALTLVYGRPLWNDALQTSTNTFENGHDFIEPLFDQAFVEDGVDKHVAIATLTPRPRSQYSCHACSPLIGGAVFRRDGELWRVESVGLEIERAHAWFDATHGRLSLVRIGPQRYGLLHRNDDMGGGYRNFKASLIFGRGGALGPRFSVRVPESGDTPGPGACPVPEVGLDVAFVADAPAGDDGLYDLVVDAAWNEATCRTVELADGPAITASGESCRRRTRYRFANGEYRPSAPEIDVCTPIPATAVSLRG